VKSDCQSQGLRPAGAFLLAASVRSPTFQSLRLSAGNIMTAAAWERTRRSPTLAASPKAPGKPLRASVDAALALDEITQRLAQILVHCCVPQRPRPLALGPVRAQPRRRPRKNLLLVVFCFILAVSPSSADAHASPTSGLSVLPCHSCRLCCSDWLAAPAAYGSTKLNS